MKICFSGWAVGIDVEDLEFTIADDEKPVDTQGFSAAEIVAKINSGEWSISFSECLSACRKSEVEIFDVEVDE